MENQIVTAVLKSLCARGGFDDWWYNLGEDIKEEITLELLNIISNNLPKSNPVAK